MNIESMSAGAGVAAMRSAAAEYGRIVDGKIQETAGSLAETFPSYFDGLMRDVVGRGLIEARADEGTIWLLDIARENLIPVFNSGPHAEEFVGHFRQSLRAGMISMVVATEQPICENDVHQNQRQDRTLDTRLGVKTCSMIAVPFYFWGELRGVMSGVQLHTPGSSEPVPQGFGWDHLQTLQRTAALLARLMEHRIVTAAIAVRPQT